MRAHLPSILFSLAALPAAAMDAGLDGYLDLRLVVPADEVSWLDGGLGKTRYGRDDSNLQFAGLVMEGHVLLTAELSAVASAVIRPGERNTVEFLEAFLRYRPVSTTPLRWSVKAGAFFPPVSLENTEVGWSSYWTLTPSAINAWVGTELRTIGAEGKLEWRRETGTLAFQLAIFGWNDPAGVMMADRGWSLDDHYTGLFERLREPDATATLFGAKKPLFTPIFKEIDNRVGVYASLTWDAAEIGQLAALYYDNRADSAKDVDEVYAWRTRFWSVAYRKELASVTILAQGMIGETIITPIPHFDRVTDFYSAYALMGWEGDDWRLAARAELYQTREHNPGPDLPFSEQGYALTLAANWLPNSWLRLTAEALYVDSKRRERELDNLAARQNDLQLQLSGRLYF